MKRLISDFSLAYIFLRSFCKKNGVPLRELPVFIDEPKTEDNSIIQIQDSSNICNTVYEIIQQYLEKSIYLYQKDINNEESLKVVKKYLQELFEKNKNKLEETPFSRSLYQHPCLWILFQDVICPAYEITCENIDLTYNSSPYLDISILIKKEEEMFILVNPIGDIAIQEAYIFIKVLEYYNLDKVELLKDLFTTELFDLFLKVLLETKTKREVSDFIDCVINLVDINLYEYLPLLNNKSDIKIAENIFGTDLMNPWWVLGLTEQMLEPAREPDEDAYVSSEQPVIEFWGKVKSNTKKPTTLESLLKMRTEYENTGEDSHKTIENKLKEERGY